MSRPDEMRRLLGQPSPPVEVPQSDEMLRIMSQSCRHFARLLCIIAKAQRFVMCVTNFLQATVVHYICA